VPALDPLGLWVGIFCGGILLLPLLHAIFFGRIRGRSWWRTFADEEKQEQPEPTGITKESDVAAFLSQHEEKLARPKERAIRILELTYITVTTKVTKIDDPSCYS